MLGHDVTLDGFRKAAGIPPLAVPVREGRAKDLFVLEDALGVDGVSAEDHERVTDGPGVLLVAAHERVAGGVRGQARPVEHVGEVTAVGEDQVAAGCGSEGLHGSVGSVGAG